MGPSARILIASLLATFATAASNPDLCPFEYIGCYSKGILQDDFTDALSGPIRIEDCLNLCYGEGYAYGGAQNGTQCWCADNLGANAAKVADGQCNIPCAGDNNELCGGTTKQTVYEIDLQQSCPAQSTSASITSSVSISTVAGPSPSAGLSTTMAPSTTAPYPINSTTVYSYSGTGSPASASISSTDGGSSNSVLGETSEGAATGSLSSTTTSGATISGSATVSPSTGTASVSSPTIAPPAPTPSGSTSECYQYYVVPQGSSCYNVQSQFGIDFNYLQSLNPSLNVACSNLVSGYAYRVNGVPAARVGGSISPSTTTPPTSMPVVTVGTVSPGQTGERSYISDGSLCQYKTYTVNIGGVTVGSMSS